MDPASPTNSSAAGDEPARATGLETDSIRRNAGFALLTQLTTSVLTAVLTLYLVRALGPDEYGLIALALAVVGLADLVAELGVTSSAARFIAENRGDRKAIVAVLGDAIRLKLVLAAIVAVVLFLVAGWIASLYGIPDLKWPLRVMAIALFFDTTFALFAESFSALGRVSYTLRAVAAESTVETGTSIALVALGAGATGAALGRTAGYCAAALLSLWFLSRLLGRTPLALVRNRGGQLRRLARYAGILALVGSVYELFVQLDAILIGAFLGASAVAAFAAPLKLITFLHYPGLAVAAGVAPRVAHPTEGRPATSAFVAALRGLTILQMGIATFVLVWAEPLVELLFGTQYDESIEVLRVLSPYILFVGIAPVVSLSANYLGEARLRLPITVATVAINVVIDVILLPRIGVVAAAIGTSAAYALYVPGHVWICRRSLRFPLRPLVVTLVRSTIAAAAGAGVLLAIGISDLGPGEWIAGIVGSGVAYVAVLVATRELTRDDVRRLRALLPKRLARR